MSFMLKVALYTSNHGFGHATRVAALAEALNRFDVYTWICTDRPVHLFNNLRPDFHNLRVTSLDCGVVHRENLVTDLDATKQALLRIMHSRGELVAAEVDFLRREQIDFVIADIPFLIVEACEYAEVPVMGISNFDWAYIYAELFKDDPSMLPVINTIKALYHRLDASFLLPFGDEDSVPGFNLPQPVGLLSRNNTLGHKDLNNLVPDQEKPILCVLFGGEGDIDLNWAVLCKAWPGYVISPNPGIKATNHIYAAPDRNYISIINSCSALLCKPGYGSFSEAVQFGKPIIYIPRSQYPEERVLIAGLKDYPGAIQISMGRQTLSNWRKIFTQVLSMTAIPPLENSNQEIAGLLINAYLRSQYKDDRIVLVGDLGSNNLNLLLYNKSTDALIHRVTLVTAIGKYVSKSRIPTEAIYMAKSRVSDALDTARAIQCDKYLIATGVFRKVDNSDDVLEWFRDQYGFKVKIIAARDEAKFASLSVGQTNRTNGDTLIFDIGGFTTEFISRTKGKKNIVSLNMGLLKLMDLPSRKMRKVISDHLKELEFSKPEKLISIGLSASLIAKALYHLSDYEMMKAEAWEVSREQLTKVQEQFTSDSSLALVPALQQLIEIHLLMLDRFALDKMMVSGFGISVGYARWIK